MGLTVEASDDSGTNVGGNKANGERDASPPVAAPTLSSPTVPVVVNGNQTKPSDVKKTDLSSLFDDPSYAELQSMIEDMEKLSESFQIQLTSTVAPESVASEPVVVEEPPTSSEPIALTSSDEQGTISATSATLDKQEAADKQGTSDEQGKSDEQGTSDEQGASDGQTTSSDGQKTSPVVEYTCKDSDVKAAVYSTVNKLKKKEASSSAGIRSYCSTHVYIYSHC